jgi:hypothetical protein
MKNAYPQGQNPDAGPGHGQDLYRPLSGLSGLPRHAPAGQIAKSGQMSGLSGLSGTARMHGSRQPAELAPTLAQRREAAARQRRHRQRNGRLSVPVEVDGEAVAFLCRLGWLLPRDAHTPDEIGVAIGRLLADAARR